MESDSECARIPSAMRFSASAASEGVAAPSNSNSRLSPITLSPCRSDPDQWTPRPSKLRAGGSRLTHGERLRYDLAPAGRLPGHALQADQLLAVDTTGRGVSPSNTLP